MLEGGRERNREREEGERGRERERGFLFDFGTDEQRPTLKKISSSSNRLQCNKIGRCVAGGGSRISFLIQTLSPSPDQRCHFV